MGVDPTFRDLVKDIKKKKGLTEKEVTRQLADELTGKRMFVREKKNEIRFNL